MAITPIIVFHDRHKIQEKDWAYVSDCTIIWVDEEDLVTEDDDVVQSEDIRKEMILDSKSLTDLIKEKPIKESYFIL